MHHFEFKSIRGATLSGKSSNVRRFLHRSATKSSVSVIISTCISAKVESGAYPFDLHIVAGNLKVDSKGRALKPFYLGKLDFDVDLSGKDLAEGFYLIRAYAGQHICNIIAPTHDCEDPS
jgi:hypothetical protein